MRRTLRLPTALLLAAALAGCGSDPEQAAAPATTAPAATNAAPSPTPSASPATDADALLPFGKITGSGGGLVTATVLGYRHDVAKGAPRPDGQPGYVWGAAQVKVCANKSNSASVGVSRGPWLLVFADDTQVEPSATGYEDFPKPEYPWSEKAVPPGRCVNGWITFPVPGKTRPVAVEYGPEGESTPPRWAVK